MNKVPMLDYMEPLLRSSVRCSYITKDLFTNLSISENDVGAHEAMHDLTAHQHVLNINFEDRFNQ
jgi:hypothetical protein